jgi:Lrp/AsnC family transcriptional regulator, regulator for asnA, asnC and gidA
MKINNFDWKILYLLELDGRKSYSEIGKNINRSKQFVAYRVKNLIENKIIRGFYTDIDLRRMGYNLFNILLQLQELTINDERKILDYFSNSKYIGYCFKTLGNWDFFLSIKTEGISDFYNFLGEFHTLFGRFIKKESINLEANSFSTNMRFLNNREDKTIEHISQSALLSEKRKFSKIEEEILLKLRENPLISYVDLSVKLGKTPETLNKIIKNLIANKVLKRTKAIISTETLGFERYLFLIGLKYLGKKQKEELFSYLKNQKNIDYAMECIGSWNIVCNVYVRNVRELVALIEDFKKELEMISSIEFLRVLESEKETFRF